MQVEELDFYTGLHRIRHSKEPFAITFVKLSLTKNEGGEKRTIEGVIPGPIRDNMNANDMIGFIDKEGFNFHVYIHSILEVKFGNTLYKLILR